MIPEELYKFQDWLKEQADNTTGEMHEHLIDYSEDREYVKQGILVRTALTILMEECAELTQAASKCIRSFDYDPFGSTPVSVQEAMDKLVEEVFDVLMAMDALDLLPDNITTAHDAKWHRWAQRAKGEERYGDEMEGVGE